MNLFALAPKELTNSAIWAWILHGLRESNEDASPRKKIAANMFRLLDICFRMPTSIFVTQLKTGLTDQTVPIWI